MADDLAATLERLRLQGADAAQPVRFHAAAAMLRRAAAHEGEARRRIDARIAALIDALRAGLDRQGAAGSAPPPAPAAPAMPAQPAEAPSLGALTQRLAAEVLARGEAPLPAPPGAGLAARPEPRAMDHFRRTWARLSAERRLTQSLDLLPENPGPLNSQHLMHRSLALMREVSPGYLHRFMARVDALAALEQVQAAPAAAPASAAKAESPRKVPRSRKGKSA